MVYQLGAYLTPPNLQKVYCLGTNRTSKLTDITNEIRNSDDTESSSEPGAGTAVCARVQCAYEATCAVDSNGQPRCACLFDCAAAAAAAATSAPVCASDLRLYPTLCHMKLESCRRQEDLRLRPLALCRGLEVSRYLVLDSHAFKATYISSFKRQTRRTCFFGCASAVTFGQTRHVFRLGFVVLPYHVTDIYICRIVQVWQENLWRCAKNYG